MRWGVPVLLLASLASLLLPGASAYWPLLGMWAVLISLLLLRSDRPLLPSYPWTISLPLLLPLLLTLIGADRGGTGALQTLLLPEIAFMLSLASLALLAPPTTPERLVFFSFVLTCSFATLSGLLLYLAGVLLVLDLVPSNAALMWHLSSALLGGLVVGTVLSYPPARARLMEDVLA